MSIRIPLTPEEERKLAELAGARGKDESLRGAKGDNGQLAGAAGKDESLRGAKGDYGELDRAAVKDESLRGAKGDYGDDVVAPYLNGADEERMKSFEEMLAPDWAEFGRSGMGDGEVDDEFKRKIRFFWTKGHRPKRMP